MTGKYRDIEYQNKYDNEIKIPKWVMILSCLLLVSFSPPIDYGSIVNKDLVLWYPLDDGGGKATYDHYHQWNAKDTLRGDAYFGNKSLVLDGTGDFISIVNAPSHLITNNFTISLWMNPLNLSQSSKHLFSKVNATFTDNNYAILWEYLNDQVEFYAGGYSGTNPRTGTGMTVPSSNVWHHIVYSYNGSNMMGYLDGILKTNISTTFSLSIASNSFLSIGGNYQFGNQFAGSIKKVRMYNRGITSNEVIRLYIDDKNDIMPQLILTN